MAKKHEAPSSGGLPPWLATYGDLATLLLCFFVLLYSMSNVDITKYKAAFSSFENQIDVMPGGIALTGEELITNGVDQLSDIELILDNKPPTAEDSESEELKIDEKKNSSTSDETTLDPSEQTSASAGNYDSKTEKIAKEIQKYLIEEGIESDIVLSYNSNYVKLTIEGEVLFDVGQAVLKPEAKGIMNSIANMIIEKNYKQYNIQIDGHTDDWDINTVQYPSNWYLSAARAIAVGVILINQYNFNPDSIACTGYGEYNPIADNETPEGRAKNRRVEIKLIVETDEVVPEDILLNKEDN
ncbi:MAG: hypothetical protein CVU84_02630 [Firmicutes bacterium HGW-Firmicutes-1]|jgi:chemotaxis protein MotB|nr:MAG: hypothetical protein CVU84_02630 [Firmicutes bacterium HGW-Firmicutes-1]